MNGLVRERFPEIRLPGAVYRSPTRQKSGSYDLGALIDANVSSFPILSNALDHGQDTSWRSGYVAWPEGDYDRIYAQGLPVDLERYATIGERWMRELSPKREIEPGTWEAIAWQSRFDAGSRLATQLMNHEVTHGGNRRYLQLAGRMLEAAAATGEPLPAAAYLNLGIYYFLQRGEDPTAVPKMVRTWQHYLESAPPGSPQIDLVREVLQDPDGAELKIGAY